MENLTSSLLRTSLPPRGDLNWLLVEDLTVSSCRTSLPPHGGIDFPLVKWLSVSSCITLLLPRGGLNCLLVERLLGLLGSFHCQWPFVDVKIRLLFYQVGLVATFYSSSGLPPSRRTCCNISVFFNNWPPWTNRYWWCCCNLTIILTRLCCRCSSQVFFADVTVRLRGHRNLLGDFVIFVNLPSWNNLSMRCLVATLIGWPIFYRDLCWWHYSPTSTLTILSRIVFPTLKSDFVGSIALRSIFPLSCHCNIPLPLHSVLQQSTSARLRQEFYWIILIRISIYSLTTIIYQHLI